MSEIKSSAIQNKKKNNNTKNKLHHYTLQNFDVLWNFHCFLSFSVNFKAYVKGHYLSIRN